MVRINIIIEDDIHYKAKMLALKRKITLIELVNLSLLEACKADEKLQQASNELPK